MILTAKQHMPPANFAPVERLRQALAQSGQPALAVGLKQNAGLARYTAARIGGAAELLLEAHDQDELAAGVAAAWALDLPCLVLGAGSNVLVSDAGVHGLVIVNRARATRFEPQNSPPQVWAESGANFGALARQAAQRGLGGLAWAAGIPGTVGGAVVGNAGAHGGDMTQNLLAAQVLRREAGAEPARETWSLADMGYAYRTSRLKTYPGAVVVLSATLRLAPQEPQVIQAEMERFLAFRRSTQPPGASLGSMFKNPPGDYAGRLIEAAGLKGARRGAAQISELHANFFVNTGGARAADVYALIVAAREAVQAQLGVTLELEVELLGDWASPTAENGPRGGRKR